ncbi:Shikimate kinase 1 [Tepidimonas alkaliphilus]|uniref:Shikimate kinase n=1 Tax=Tepidimonas alkaliphilus TaxID=2588942 RepID=A0A554W9H2_9BURK|nr:shikimate kinase [Tepidimonas alkaliphilus]TSE20223.1 Shikimate kinase 1 [Tepidimonas alkaliphilus]
MTARVVLIGLPGAGKTTVGRQLARRLQLPFVDSDAVIEERLGCSIREFFEREGEEPFRDLEEAVLEELTRGEPCVLSTGGGAVLRAANRQRLRARGRVFYLRSTPEELMRRLRHDRTRPLLQVTDPLQRLRELHAVRDPLYRETAHHVIDTGRPSVTLLVHTILMQLELGAPAEGEAPSR